MSQTWAGDWRRSIHAIVRKMGFNDVHDFLTSNRGRSFGELFGILRNNAEASANTIAFVQFPELYYEDASRRGLLRDAMMEALVRAFAQCMPKGWNRGPNARARRLKVLANWHIPSRYFEEYQKLKERVWHELEAAMPRDDWCPVDRHDEIIQDVFARVWPIGKDVHQPPRMSARTAAKENEEKNGATDKVPGTHKT